MPFLLVVDDNVDIARAVATFARLVDCEAVAVHDGESALAILRDRPVGLVILDFHMPDISGGDILRAIQADPAIPSNTPVAVFSADDACRAESMRLGAVAFVSKVASLEDLVPLLQRYCHCHP